MGSIEFIKPINTRKWHTIPVVFDLSEISPSCDPRILKAAAQNGSPRLVLDFPILIPKNKDVIRKSLDLTDKEIVEFQAAVSFLHSWFALHFPLFPKDSFILQSVPAQWTCIIPLLEPLTGHSLKSKWGLAMSLVLAFTRFLDVCIDIPTLLPTPVPDKKAIMKGVMPFLIQLEEAFKSGANKDPNIGNGLTEVLVQTMRSFLGQKEIHENPFIAMIMGALLDMAETLGDSLPLELKGSPSKSMISLYAGWMGNLYKVWEAQGVMEEVQGTGLSSGTLHRFRGNEAAGFWLSQSPGAFLHEKVEILPPSILDHSLVSQIAEIQSQIMGSINDILGIKKDLQNNETSAPLFQDILKTGCTLGEALKKEIRFLKEKLDDVLILEEIIIEKTTKEYGNEARKAMESYLEALEVLDIVLIQLFQFSPKYSQGIQIDLDKILTANNHD